MKSPKSKTYFDKQEYEEWHQTEPEPELNPLRALQSQPDFFRKHLAGAPNLKAVAAILGMPKKDEDESGG